VAFFFVLSGFVLAWGTRPDLSPRTFWRRRFARVWPSHAVMLVVAAVVPIVAVERSLPAAAANVVLVQAWFVHDPGIVFGMNGPSWSLSCEAFFYAAFPLTVVVLRRLPRRTGWLLAAGGLVCSALAVLLIHRAAFPLPAIRYSEFLLGVVAGLAVRDGWRPRPSVPLTAAVLMAGLAVSQFLPDPMPDAVMAPSFLLVLLCAAARDLDGRAGWLRSRLMVFAGEASFALYLVHEVVIVNLRDPLRLNGWVEAAIALGISCVGAVVLHLAVERPCNSLLRGGRVPSVALAPPSAEAPPTRDGTPTSPPQQEDPR
jgi:peptidoglycan/LPS O-acetylase OafA/YrhL